MLYCEKVNCIYFETYKDWAIMPDGDEMPYQAVWCKKLHKELSLLDHERLYFHGCSLALPQESQQIQRKDGI